MSDERLSSESSDCSADVAAYALGALEPAEAEAFARHLETCVVCPIELRAFQQVVDDIAISPPTVPAPPELRRSVLRAVAAEPRAATGRERQATGRRHRRRRREEVLSRDTWLRGPTLALGAGIAFAVAAIVVVVLAFPGHQANRTVDAAVVGPGSATLHISAHHTDLVLDHFSAPPRGDIYEVWLKRGSGSPHPAGALFSVNAGGDASVDVPGSLYGVSQVMVTAEPGPGGTRVPTTSPVITAAL